eukprot:CCRYP_003073-RB/>CCRYP_003073-RB protein AED:0.04 eAED:0.04 QI:258/1/1/1/1/0.8/5/212/865
MTANSEMNHLRTVDNKPIIVKVKHALPELAVIDEHGVRGDTETETCSCPKKCLLIEKIPIDQGIMVMMDEPTASSSESKTRLENGSTSDGQNCTCLKIQPQSDSNLADIHPNIYIPSSLLDYPEQIRKYGGGGSGVTVFGGFHPQLGSLVMKHGGHKDLLELVSLYKIERELMARGNAKMDLIAKAVAKENDPRESKASNSNRRYSLNAFGGNLTAGASKVVRKISSQPIMSRVGSLLFRRGSIFDNKEGSTAASISRVGTMPISSSYQSFDLMQKPCHAIEDSGDGYYAQLQEIESAIDYMKQRIPAFRMLYISPMHLREREGELRNSTFRASLRTSLQSSCDGRHASSSEINDRKLDESAQEKEPQVSITKSGRSICLFGSSHASSSSIRTHSQHVDLCFGGGYRLWRGADGEEKEPRDNTDSTHTCHPEEEGNDGYESLLAFVNQLYHHMLLNNWKVTLAQQTIGRSHEEPTKSAPTASSLLAKGKLKGSLLHHLLDEEIRVIRNLQLLTMPNEVDVLDGVRMEYESIKARMRSANASENKVTAADVSTIANNFVGKAIHKNFHPVTGRFVLLKKFGADLRNGLIHLKPKELQPAKHLEKILNDCFERDGGDFRGCDSMKKQSSLRQSLEEIFDLSVVDESADEEHPLQGHPLFIHGLDQWQYLLELALSMKNPNATSRIWTCGLTDGGLHNLFLDKNQVWMFDLGEPGLETIPGFLTKFLMSFFHTLGMEEEPNGDWVVRFVQNSDKLRLTEKTKELLPSVIEAFNIAIDRLIKEIFGGDEEVRILLLRYVMTQLISDAAFCIEKWRIKGGGDKERSEHQYYLEKWLWRSLWDVYACEEIRRRHISRQAMKRQDSHMKRLI